MNGIHPSLHCGELAHLTGVSPDTIRHYERIGVLPESPRSASGYRLYDRGAIERVHLVQRALQLGFTLDELSEILKVKDQGGAPCKRVLSLAEEKLRSLESRINELRKTQHYIKQLVRQWRSRLARARPGSKAMLLQSLADKSPTSLNLAQNFRRKK